MHMLAREIIIALTPHKRKESFSFCGNGINIHLDARPKTGKFLLVLQVKRGYGGVRNVQKYTVYGIRTAGVYLKVYSCFSTFERDAVLNLRVQIAFVK